MEQTDPWTNRPGLQPTDGQALLWRFDDASKKHSKNDLVANKNNDNYLYESVSDCFQIALLLLDRILSPCLKNLLQYIMFIKF